jgi:prophage regulatory protein
MNDISILRQPAARERLGDSRSGFYNKVKSGLCTPAVKLGLRACGWPDNEIDAINRARIAGKSEDEIRELVKQLIAQRTERAAA